MPSDLTGPTSHTYFSQRLRLHYVDWGNADAPPLVLLHGGRDHCRNWDWVAQALRGDWHVIAPDLRGHGDSQWTRGSTYSHAELVYDLAQLVHQLELAPVTLIGHSLGAGTCLRYAGVYPENVGKLVAIEGLGPGPKRARQMADKPAHQRLRQWVDDMRALAGRVPRRYTSLDEALARMQAANPHLSPEQARHLTVHGMHRNEDGSYSWKFDNYVRAFTPYGAGDADTQDLWRRITCPTLHIRGLDSWTTDPTADGRAACFQNARFVDFEDAGHWVHHDQLEKFLATVREFLAGE